MEKASHLHPLSMPEWGGNTFGCMLFFSFLLSFRKEKEIVNANAGG